MLARRTELLLPDGTRCDLPLLVPSFSSKGSGFLQKGRRKAAPRISFASADLYDFGRTPSLAVMISAFDLHFRHFRMRGDSTGDCLDWIPQVRIVFLDSGGYELAPDFDLSEPKDPPYQAPDGYGRNEYLGVLTRIARRVGKRNFVVSNFDWGTRGQALERQIADARAIKRHRPGVLHSFILKPWTKGMLIVEPRRIPAASIEDLAGFDIIGITEKELGADLLERLRRLAQLRTAFDRAGLKVPIHVWGGLDPVLTALYFFAGAEIFDGISWLRYAYVDGLAVNRECAAALDQNLGVLQPRRLVHPMTGLHNRTYLDRLSVQLLQWADGEGKSFRMFPEPMRGRLEVVYGTMRTRIPELREQ